MCVKENNRLPHLRLAITSKCNFNCVYCRDGGEGVLTNNEMTQDEIIKVLKCASEIGFKSLKITGGEPLIREENQHDLIEIIKYISKHSFFENIQMVTNGSLLSKYCNSLVDSGIDGITVSLDSIDNDVFLALTNRNELQNVLDGISKIHSMGLYTTINSVVTKENIGKLDDLILFAAKNSNKLKLLDYIQMPNNKLSDGSYINLACLKNKLEALSNKQSIELPPGGLGTPMSKYTVSSDFEIIVKDATVGTNYHETCKTCKNYPCQDALISLRITANGLLKKCLLRDDNLINILDDLRNDDIYSVKEKMASVFNVLLNSNYYEKAWIPQNI